MLSKRLVDPVRSLARSSLPRHASQVCAVALAILFLLAAADKIAHYAKFVAAVETYIIAPRNWAHYIAPVIVLLEFWIGLNLLFARSRAAAAFVACLILLLFCTALSVNLLAGVRSGCGCWFTITLGKASALHVAQDLLLALFAWSIWMDLRRVGKNRSNHLGSLAPSS